MGSVTRGFYEFFAGGGMARAGLGDDWHCLLANDIDPKKARAYERNWGKESLVVADIATLLPSSLPETAALAWASFPCQDLSLAGAGAGISGARSGVFWSFWELIRKLADEKRAPSIVVLENVCGTLTSHQGQDFAALCSAIFEVGYRFGAIVVDAVSFVPQSRPRLFVVAVRKDMSIPESLHAPRPSSSWHPKNLITAQRNLSDQTRNGWIWWNMPEPPSRNTVFSNLIEEDPKDVKWLTPKEVDKLFSMMSEKNLEKVIAAQLRGGRQAGTIYKRTRVNTTGTKVQRAEVRFDGIAGCLRTPAGGSSRQLILLVERDDISARLISAREGARLMGLHDEYLLPENYNDAYHLVGDGVAVPVVRHLSENLIKPIIDNNDFCGSQHPIAGLRIRNSRTISDHFSETLQ